MAIVALKLLIFLLVAAVLIAVAMTLFTLLMTYAAVLERHYRQAIRENTRAQDS